MSNLSQSAASLATLLLLILLPLAFWVASSIERRSHDVPAPGGDMDQPTRALFDKAARVIDTSGTQHKEAIVRWLSLMNWQAHQQPWSGDFAGASQGIRYRFEQKFGPFCPKTVAVARVDRHA